MLRGFLVQILFRLPLIASMHRTSACWCCGCFQQILPLQQLLLLRHLPLYLLLLLLQVLLVLMLECIALVQHRRGRQHLPVFGGVKLGVGICIRSIEPQTLNPSP